MNHDHPAIRPYPLDSLEREISSMPVGDEQAFLEFIAQASRLASLGRPSQLDLFPELLGKFPDFGAALQDRCKEGVWELRNALGEDLGFAVIAAQDFFCFLGQIPPGSLPGLAEKSLEAWFDEAEHAPLDVEAAACLEDFLARFPIPEDLRLAVVDSPITEQELSLLDGAAVTALQATEPVHVALPGKRFLSAPALAASTGAVTDDVRKQYRRLNKVVPVDGFGDVHVSRRLDDEGDVALDLKTPAGDPVAVESARLGPHPGRWAGEEHPETWTFVLHHLPLENALKALEEPITLHLADGTTWVLE